jgi:serine/threonine protein phosphatase PrpC
VTISIRMASVSEIGARSGNEDNLRTGHGASGWFAILADGAGGHHHGTEAARRAVTRIEAELSAPGARFSARALTAAIAAAHADVRDDDEAQTAQQRMHSTVVALWLDPQGERALWSHVGDSRLYRVRHGRVDAVTVDDSVVQRLVHAGIITAEQARVHPQKNQLLAALGIEGELSPHTLSQAVDVLEGDAFLLCSDGWWDHFEPPDVASELAAARSPADWLDGMKLHIAAQQRPRQDNYSAVAVWVGDPSDVTQPLPRRLA